MDAIYRDIVPSAPEWSIDWPSIEAAFDWFRHLSGCPQDPVYHAEGDVAIHTRMVCEALVAARGWQSLDEETRALVFWAALLHDIAKPACTREDVDGRIRAPGHSKRGQIMARQVLWAMGLAYPAREVICHLITHHQVPFYLVETHDPERRAHLISHQTRCDLLALLAHADASGRICHDQQHLLDNVELFSELCRQENCLESPRTFASDHSRFWYFRKPGRSADYEAFDDTRSHVTLMSGLPASGKDSWLSAQTSNGTVVSLDRIRAEMKISASDNQGPVVATAKDQARSVLRKGEPLVWNATNLSRDIRQQLIGLFADYNARVEIVYCETSQTEQERRNTGRSDPVPANAIKRMLDRWETPDLTECHNLSVVVS